MRFTILLAFLFMVSCGFSPVYQSNHQGTSASLSNIDIAMIPNEEGVIMRNYLMDRMYKNGYPLNAEYKLVTAPIKEQIIEIAIDQDDNASRAQLRQATSFRLVRLSDDQVVLSRSVRATTGYNILEGQFTTFVTRSDAREQALRLLADKVMIQLELYFAQ